MLTKLTLSTPHSSLSLYPERGAIITSLIFGGQEILFQDMLQDTLFDPSTSVRGGIPILFPNSGPLTDEEKILLGHNLPQHGFLRNTSHFQIISHSENAIILEYKNTRENPVFPYNFIFHYELILSETRLDIKSSIKNIDTKNIPIAPGFHPYFPIKDASSLKIRTANHDYTSEIQNHKNIWKNSGTHMLEITQREDIEIQTDRCCIKFKMDDSFKNILIWSLPNKDFVCIEPVFGPDGMIAKNPVFVASGCTQDVLFSLYI